MAAQVRTPGERASAALRRKRAAARRAEPLPRRRIHDGIMPAHVRRRAGGAAIGAPARSGRNYAVRKPHRTAGGAAFGLLRAKPLRLRRPRQPDRALATLREWTVHGDLPSRRRICCARVTNRARSSSSWLEVGGPRWDHEPFLFCGTEGQESSTGGWTLKNASLRSRSTTVPQNGRSRCWRCFAHLMFGRRFS